MNSIIEFHIGQFSYGSDLLPGEAEKLLDAMTGSEAETLLANLFYVWNKKGISADEIYAIAEVMRRRMTRVRSHHGSFVDIVGTGGSISKTFNVSTAASFVVAGAGMPVAKHGNKAATSNTGSSDVLSELQIDPAVSPEKAEQCLNEIGICFMFAPNYHRLSPTLAKVRRGLGFPTIFNCVGPLCNPASAPHQLIGVWDEELVRPIADALSKLGAKRSWIVFGEGGLDEIALSGWTKVAEVDGKDVKTFDITPEYFGFESASTHGLRSNDPSHSSEMIRNVLLGKPHSQAAENLVLINAAAALYLAGAAATPAEAAALARSSLQSGRAHSKMEELAKAIPV